ncbi:BON domain-containing protein [Paraburkholderia tropica]|uniref:BON domain-containing protein n=1 Tax=Paraburkholderia tropica TaxID=92647 RepID=UPI003D26A6E5
MKIAASILLIAGATWFGIAQAADSEANAVDQSGSIKPGYFSPQRKAERAEDRALEKRVRVALEKKGLNMTDVTVIARHGKVILAGTVPDNTQIQLAGNSATSVGGVVSLKNDLDIGYPGN